MKRPKLIHEEITIGEGQIVGQILPNKKPPTMYGVDCSEIDILRIQFTGIEGDTQDFYFTPDEALETASLLSDMVRWYLLAVSEGYRKEILEKRWVIEAKRSKNKKIT